MQVFDRFALVGLTPYDASTVSRLTEYSSRGLITNPNLRVCFPLRCFQRLSFRNNSYPAMLLTKQPAHQGFLQPGPLVLRPAPFKIRTIPQDRVRTVSRRSEPSSRTTLMGEQTNPWHLLQRQDVMSRHRVNQSAFAVA